MKMNKKANTSIIILVIGTIALCVVALIAFKNIRAGRSSKIQAFRELRVMYNVLDDIEFSGKDLSYVQEELYLEDYRSYKPVVDELKIRPIGGRDYLVLERQEYTLKIPVE